MKKEEEDQNKRKNDDADEARKRRKRSGKMMMRMKKEEEEKKKRRNDDEEEKRRRRCCSVDSTIAQFEASQLHILCRAIRTVTSSIIVKNPFLCNFGLIQLYDIKSSQAEMEEKITGQKLSKA